MLRLYCMFFAYFISFFSLAHRTEIVKFVKYPTKSVMVLADPLEGKGKEGIIFHELPLTKMSYISYVKPMSPLSHSEPAVPLEILQVYTTVFHTFPHIVNYNFLSSLTISTSGILYFFRSPHSGLFSLKNQKKILAINNFFCQ